jgi:hypothetical protein
MEFSFDGLRERVRTAGEEEIDVRHQEVKLEVLA